METKVVQIGNHCLPHKHDSFPTKYVKIYIENAAIVPVNGYIDEFLFM